MSETLIDTKKVLQDKLNRLLTFYASSPKIFAPIAELEALVNQGATQAGGVWTGSSCSIPKDYSGRPPFPKSGNYEQKR